MFAVAIAAVESGTRRRAEVTALARSDPKKFYTTPHYNGYPTVLVNLKAVGVRELRELIVESWRVKAPKRVRKTYGDTL